MRRDVNGGDKQPFPGCALTSTPAGLPGAGSRSLMLPAWRIRWPAVLALLRRRRRPRRDHARRAVRPRHLARPDTRRRDRDLDFTRQPGPGPSPLRSKTSAIVTRARLLLGGLVEQSGPAPGYAFGRGSWGLHHLARLQIKRSLCGRRWRNMIPGESFGCGPFDPAGFRRDAAARGAQTAYAHRRTAGRRCEPGIQRLIAQLSAQSYPDWSVAVGAAAGDGGRLRFPS